MLVLVFHVSRLESLVFLWLRRGGSRKTFPFRMFPSRLSCLFAWQAFHFVTLFFFPGFWGFARQPGVWHFTPSSTVKQPTAYIGAQVSKQHAWLHPCLCAVLLQSVAKLHLCNFVASTASAFCCHVCNKHCHTHTRLWKAKMAWALYLDRYMIYIYIYNFYIFIHIGNMFCCSSSNYFLILVLYH